MASHLHYCLGQWDCIVPVRSKQCKHKGAHLALTMKSWQSAATCARHVLKVKTYVKKYTENALEICSKPIQDRNVSRGCTRVRARVHACAHVCMRACATWQAAWIWSMVYCPSARAAATSSRSPTRASKPEPVKLPLSACVCACSFVRSFVRWFVRSLIRECVSVCVCARARVHVCARACSFVRVFVRACSCVGACSCNALKHELGVPGLKVMRMPSRLVVRSACGWAASPSHAPIYEYFSFRQN